MSPQAYVTLCLGILSKGGRGEHSPPNLGGLMFFGFLSPPSASFRFRFTSMGDTPIPPLGFREHICELIVRGRCVHLVFCNNAMLGKSMACTLFCCCWFGKVQIGHGADVCQVHRFLDDLFFCVWCADKFNVIDTGDCRDFGCYLYG